MRHISPNVTGFTLGWRLSVATGCLHASRWLVSRQETQPSHPETPWTVSEIMTNRPSWETLEKHISPNGTGFTLRRRVSASTGWLTASVLSVSRQKNDPIRPERREPSEKCLRRKPMSKTNRFRASWEDGELAGGFISERRTQNLRSWHALATLRLRKLADRSNRWWAPARWDVAAGKPVVRNQDVENLRHGF